MKHFLVICLFLMASVGFAKSQDGVYEVPGFNGADFARFPISVNLEQNGANVSIDYDLPEMLTGAANRIRAEGTMISANLAVLRGPKSHVTCDIPNNLCSITYKNLDFDLDGLKGTLERSGLSAEDIQNRMAVAAQFRRDPEGIVRYGVRYSFAR